MPPSSSINKTRLDKHLIHIFGKIIKKMIFVKLKKRSALACWIFGKFFQIKGDAMG